MNEVLEKVKALTESHEAISNKFKALVESNKAMNEELSILQEDLKNMSEKELQLLEGTSEKFQVLDSEDANGSEDVADLEEFLDLKEFVSFNDPCKGPIAVQVQVHSTPQTLVETIIAYPVQDQRILGRQPSLVVQSLSVEHQKKVSKFYNELLLSLASCKGVEVFFFSIPFKGETNKNTVQNITPYL